LTGKNRNTMNTNEILRRFENQIESLNDTQDLIDYAHNMLGGLLVEIRNNLVKESDSLPCVISWVAFDYMNLDTRPKKYGKYLIVRKDGKTHWETWNGSGWAYNHNEIRYWAEIKPPCL
jgi:hypothetical protein